MATKKVNSTIEKVIQEAVGQLFNNIIVDTPVDTGALLANWTASINSMQTGDVGQTDQFGERTASNAKSVVMKMKLGDTAYLVNSLDYAEIIEYGHSRQAPAGMMRVNCAVFDSIVASVTAKYGDK